MTGMNTTPYREKLEAERHVLETELASVGKRNPSNPKDWEPRGSDLNVLQSDRNEAADRAEEFGENVAILHDLEIRYNNVLYALEKIEQGTYGTCEVCGAQIEEARLEANPAAVTCIAHRDTEHAQT